MMKRIIIITGILSVFLFTAPGQPVSQATGTISGKVVESKSNLPVEYANIVILNMDSSLVNGSITTNEGIFIINHVPFGRYRMKVSFIGYEEVWVDTLFLNNRNKNIYFEKILLQQSAAVLTNVQITGQRSVLEMQIDRKVFNVDQSIVSQGQSATEVLETVPSVEVDMDGNVSLRGSGNVTILIDGRPSAMMGSDVATALKQIPANMIESIEIITNPSAKYDPEGMSGIINIKLKKDRKGGLNGVVSAGYGTWNKYNASLNLNYRTQKYNLFTSYSTNNRNFFRTGTTFTTNKQDPDSFYYTSQDMFMRGQHNSHMFRGGADYYINKKNTLSAFFTINSSTRSSNDTVNTIYQDANLTSSAIADRISGNEDRGYGYNMVMTWQKVFNKPGQELLVDANYSFNNDDEEADYMDEYTLFDYQPSLLEAMERKWAIDRNTVASLQLDYTHPITATTKLEGGARIGYRKLDDDQDASFFDPMNDVWMPDSNRINRYIYDEVIAALYATYSGKLNKLTYKAGLRFEQTMTKGNLVNEADTFQNQYPALFPSAHFSYKLNKDNEFQLSYSRRISRPRSGMLNPFSDYSDPMNIRQGNPFLEPEFTNSIELGYSRFFKKASLISSIFYRQVNDQIERFKIINPEGVTVMTFRNLTKGVQYGYELIGTYNAYKWWTLTANFNMNQRILDAEKIQPGLSNSGLMWSVKMMSTMNLKTGTSIQLSGNYSSPRILTLGVSAPRYGMDIGVRQSLMKNRASLSLRVSDVFYTSSWIMSLEGSGFSQEIERYFDSRVAFLTFTYQFGKQQRDNKARQRGQRENGEDSEGGGEMMF
jgi:outer membrane receptor protein involved in Fe transport